MVESTAQKKRILKIFAIFHLRFIASVHTRTRMTQKHVFIGTLTMLAMILIFVAIALFASANPVCVVDQNESLHCVTLPSGMQQSRTQAEITVNEISRVYKMKGHCNLLIFGLGYDSSFWHDINFRGRTVFIEDSQEWISNVQQTQGKNFEIVKVQYQTELERDKNKFKDTSLWTALRMDLPIEITKTEWDIVIVDAPMGYKKGDPGRWQSIYMAASLRRLKQSLTVIDDCDRSTENDFALLVFGRQNLKRRVKRGFRLTVAANEQCYFWGKHDNNLQQIAL